MHRMPGRLSPGAVPRKYRAWKTFSSERVLVMGSLVQQACYRRVPMINEVEQVAHTDLDGRVRSGVMHLGALMATHRQQALATRERTKETINVT